MAGQSLVVTGASGLLGANICEAAAKKGYAVRALLRPGASRAEFEPLARLGVAFVEGDVTDLESLRRAAAGADGFIHSAAAVGGTWATFTPQQMEDVNYHGAVNVLEAARQAGVRRTVMINTVGILDNAFTMTERSPLAEIKPSDSLYTRAKRAAYHEGMRRAALGQDIVTVTPAGIYGPSPVTARALVRTSFNASLLLALRKEFDGYGDFPLCWVYAPNGAEIALRAFEAGSPGMRYMAAGHPRDAMSLPKLCNRACAMAGVDHRVADIPVAQATKELGSILHLAERRYADPMADPSFTTAALGIAPVPVSEGLPKLLAWLRQIGQLSASPR